jgi:hypothetical protein
VGKDDKSVRNTGAGDRAWLDADANALSTADKLLLHIASSVGKTAAPVEDACKMVETFEERRKKVRRQANGD